MSVVLKWESCYQLGKRGDYCFAQLVCVENVNIQIKVSAQSLQCQKQSEKNRTWLFPMSLREEHFHLPVKFDVKLWGEIYDSRKNKH